MKDITVRTVEQLGAAVRLRRKEKRLSQSELADLLGAGRKWVINFEAGNSRAELGLVLRAAEALDLRVFLSVGDKETSGRMSGDSTSLDEVFRRLQRQ